MTLPPPNELEDQLLVDGHEPRLRSLLAEATSASALTCSHDEFVKRLKNNKVNCIPPITRKPSPKTNAAARRGLVSRVELAVCRMVAV